jgi:hypothetical protein
MLGRRGHGVAFSALLLAACVDGSGTTSGRCGRDADCPTGFCLEGECRSGDGEVEADTRSDAVPDLWRADETSDGEFEFLGFGEDCSANAECESGYCIDVAGGRICTQLCSEICPEGFACRTLVNTGADAVRLCIPIPDVLCGHCSNHSECGGGGSYCLPQLNGTFCATDCSGNAACAEGYSCNLQVLTGVGPDGEDVETRLCEPRGGRCIRYHLSGPGFTAVAQHFGSERFELRGRIVALPHNAQSPTFHLSGGF